MPTLRALTEDELPIAAELFLTAVNEMMSRFGLPAVTVPLQAQIEAYRQVHRTGIFQVAEEGGQIGAICCAIQREDQWFLSGFWGRPGQTQQGLGGPLLRQVYELAAARGARRFFTWSSADPTAMASYLRLGLWPAGPILTLIGPKPPPEVSPLAAHPLDPAAIAELDREVRGVRRPEDHRYLLEHGQGRIFERDGRVVGYGYAQGNLLGPIAWARDEDAVSVLTATAGLAPGPELRIAIPSQNRAALAFVMDRRWRLFWFAHLMQSEPFGELSRYVPSGPLLF
jgi:GNAT superfamily N-acetyltransferase